MNMRLWGRFPIHSDLDGVGIWETRLDKLRFCDCHFSLLLSSFVGWAFSDVLMMLCLLALAMEIIEPTTIEPNLVR
jgi:hypothetical protein